MVGGLTDLLKPKWLENRWVSAKTNKSFYELQDNSAEVVFFGASIISAAMDPFQLYEEQGISSYNLGVMSQPMIGTYYWFKEALKTQNMKLAVIEIKSAGRSSEKAEEKARQEKLIQEEEAKNKQRQESIEQAEVMAQGYDYDGAIELLKSLENYDKDADIIAKIASYEADKSTLVAVNMNEITHIFYHSLVVDPERAFVGNDSTAAGFKQWMTTVDEFNKITQAMYDNGYVLIDLHDMVTETVDENGTVHFTTNQIMLPEGKKPFVLSLDDLSYYHSYDGRGVASKIVLDENGKPTCEYIQADGTTVTGAYDCIPLLDQFLEEHPDGAYHGARGTIALTGYNGILGYRTG